MNSIIYVIFPSSPVLYCRAKSNVAAFHCAPFTPDTHTLLLIPDRYNSAIKPPLTLAANITIEENTITTIILLIYYITSQSNPFNIIPTCVSHFIIIVLVIRCGRMAATCYSQVSSG